MAEQPCSDAARERGDPLVGTAPPARRWLLVEQDGAWGVDGFSESPLPAEVVEQVSAAAGSAGARILLVRRPGRSASPVCLMRAWCVVDTTTAPPRLDWGTWAHPYDLLEAADRLAALGPPRGRPPGPAPTPAPAPAATGPELLLVCTHGRHDRCCAVRGRPVAAALARRWPEATWECSHVGGDRFAANLLVLPDAALYGGLDAADAVPLVEDHLTGAVRAARLRGVAGVRPPAQAAVVAAYERLGPLPWGAVHPLALQEHGEGRWEVALQVEGHGAVTVDVVVHRQPAHRLTCRADQPSRALVPVAGDLRPRTPAGAPAPRTDTG